MHRFFLPLTETSRPELLLTGSEAHHALNVLRIEPGQTVTVLNGAGDEFLCEVTHCGRSGVSLAVREKRSSAPPPFEVTLLQALLKGKTFDFIVEKATELGTNRIVPLLTERTVARPAPQESAHKVEKWETSAIAAIKQCGSPWLPRIEPPVHPKQFLDRAEQFDLALIASLAPGARHPAELFREFRARHQRQPGSVAVWVGPEGDFSAGELQLVQVSGALPITLGPLVLRADTAAVYCLSIINYELRQP